MAKKRVDSVLSVLGSSASPLTTHNVAQAAGLEPRETYAVLYQLLQDRRVQRGGAGRRAKAGEKQVRWRLNPHHDLPQSQVTSPIESEGAAG
jgi:hypothetical protein